MQIEHLNTSQSIQEEQLLSKQNRVKQKSIRRQLLVVSLLNLFTFLSFVFAMSYYKWLWVELQFARKGFDSKVHRYWVNLLYVREDLEGAGYESFGAAEARVCVRDIYCSAIFYQLKFVGILCFSIFAIAVLLQLLQFGRMIYYILSLSKIVQTRTTFKYLVSIGTYCLGLTLNAFSLSVMDNIDYKYGILYWLCAGILAIFMFTIVYGKFWLRRMVKEAMIQNLLGLEREVRNQKIMKAGGLTDDQGTKTDEVLTL